jgi:hypothetical protein
MQMTLTIAAESPAEMATVLQALQGAGVTSAVTLKTNAAHDETKVATPETAPATSPAPRRGRPPKVDPSASQAERTEAVEPKTAKLAVVPKEDPKPEPKPEPPPKKDVTILDVRKALTEYLQANSEVAAGELLRKHGHTDRLSLLAPEHFEAVYAAAVTPVAKTSAVFDDDISHVGAQ